MTDLHGEEWSWYWARVWFRTHRRVRRSRKNLWQKSVILLRARSAEEAQERAEVKAREREFEYDVIGGDRLAWRFVVVEEVQELDDAHLEDGVEAYWEFAYRVDKQLESTVWNNDQ